MSAALLVAKLAAMMPAGGRTRGRARRLPTVATALSLAFALTAAGGVAYPAAAAAAAAPAGGGNTCLRRLVTHAAEFAACRTGTTCFLFIEEDPFIVIGDITAADSPLNPRTPFSCTAYAKRNVSGVAFKLYEQLWPSGPDLCVYAGGIDECTFTSLVNYLNDTRTPDHAGHGLALAVTGALVFSPERRRLGISSDSILEDSLLMVRRRGSQSAQWRSSPFNAAALARPFTGRAWVVVAQAGACVVAMTGVLSTWRPTPVLGGRERGWNLRQLKLAALQWVFNLYG